MKIFLVMLCVPYESNGVCSVHRSKETAKKAMNDIDKTKYPSDYFWYVEEATLED
jgi:hypothetical protein